MSGVPKGQIRRIPRATMTAGFWRDHCGVFPVGQTPARQMSSIGRASNAESVLRGQSQIPAGALDFDGQSTQNKHSHARSFVPLGHSTIAHRFNGGSAKLVNRPKSPKGRHNSSPIGKDNGDRSNTVRHSDCFSGWTWFFDWSGQGRPTTAARGIQPRELELP